MVKDYYEMASELANHPDIDAVRVDYKRMVVAYAPEERHVEKIPESAYQKIMSVIENTPWKCEYSDAGRNAEKHKWSGGQTHSPVLDTSDQPAGYELQYLLVNTGLPKL